MPRDRRTRTGYAARVESAAEDGQSAASGDAALGPRPQYPIESVDNALKILLLLGERRSIRLTDVSEILDVASSTAHRLLAMLQYRGFVRQSGRTRAYEPGPALTTIAFSILRQGDIRGQMRPYVERLSASLGETVHLGRLEGTLVTFVDSVESPRAVRVASRLGVTMPAHCTSSGKAVLATMTDDDVRALYPAEELPGLTENSIATRSDLLSQLARVREQGYAGSIEESEEGVASIAVCIGEYADTRYALNVSAPLSRMNDTTRPEIIDEIRRTATEVAGLFH